MPKKLFLIDGSNHAFRVFHGMPKMTANGVHTGALLGFANMLRKLQREHEPDYIVVVFDKGPSFRVDIYADYKGHRPEMPEELREQWPRFEELVEAWGYRYLAIENLEADDIIGTLAKRWAGEDLKAVLVTGDKDLCQLVDENITILDIMKDQLIDTAGVVDRFGVPPERVVDILALAGDASDNIPGVRGIGVKTASQYVQKYGGLEDVIAHAADIGGKRGKTIADEAESARLSYTLATIKVDCELPLTLEELEAHDRDDDRLRSLFMAWQFRTHLRDLQEESPAVAEASPVDLDKYRTVRTLEQLDVAIGRIRKAGRVAVDTETTSLDPLQAKLVGVCLSWSADDAVYVPVGHTEGEQLSEAMAMSRIGPLLRDPNIIKVGQNLKYDLSVLAQNGYAIAGIGGDTMLADYLLEPDRNRHGLDDLALRYLGHSMIAYAEATAGLGPNATFADVPIDKATRYGAEDAHVTWLLDQELGKRLEAAQLTEVYRDIELPLVPVLSEMERNGIGLDVERLKALSVELTGRIKELQDEIYKLAGRKFTINSPKQLREVLFDELGLEPIKKTKTGFSTDASTLERLRNQHPLPGTILDFRALTKLKSTYVDTLPSAVSKVTGRVHTSFHQAVAATGRLSSNDPNLQNIPVRSDDGRRIRDCFIAAEGQVFLSCDYSQVELRLLAHYCKEGPLVEAFLQGQDIHRRTASEIFGVAQDAVTPTQRSAAKAINFGIVYGMSAFRLSNDLGIPRGEAQAYIDNYFARYSQVRTYMDQAIADAKANGFARTLWGRRRPIADLTSRNVRDRMAAERIAINTPIQGSAADLIKIAMARVHRRLHAEAPDAKLLLQVHDELLLEVPEGRVDAVAALVKQEMESAAELVVPLRVDTGHARTWAGAH
ncbi:MAG: DNA polymerase I [Alphaproteobacteria bacterium]|nr:DNA polymerase I [Alphaproteobacteria bacterium]